MISFLRRTGRLRTGWATCQQRPLVLESQSALTQVVLPVHVVDVDHLAVRVEVEHPVDGLADQFDVVADHDQPALVPLQELAQPHDAVSIEVVGRLVEDHRLCVGEKDASEFDAPALTAGESVQRLVEDAIRQRQVVRDGGCLSPRPHSRPAIRTAR